MNQTLHDPLPSPSNIGPIQLNPQWRKFTFSGGGGAKPPKFPTKLSNFRQPPPHLHLKRMFLALFLAQVSVKVGGGRPPPPSPPH
jgi:hypothetical protein